MPVLLIRRCDSRLRSGAGWLDRGGGHAKPFMAIDPDAPRFATHDDGLTVVAIAAVILYDSVYARLELGDTQRLFKEWRRLRIGSHRSGGTSEHSALQWQPSLLDRQQNSLPSWHEAGGC